MDKLGWLFPGQASQKVGMGLDLYNETEMGRKYFDRAQDIMGYDIQSIIFEGPEDILKQTEYTQPAIYTVSVILGYLLLEKGLKPSALAGHSLGEYSALTIAGAFNFDTGLRLVKDRALFMAKAGQIQKGTMAAIVGIDDDMIESICSDYEGNGIVVAANYNSPGQVVISGSPDGVKWVVNIAKDYGARMAVELNVSGAFHSPLMAPAREQLAEVLNSLEISDSKYAVYTNVDSKPVVKSQDIRDSLIRQLENPVLWHKSILNMKGFGIKSFIEVGPGKVLQGLNKRIDRSLKCDRIESLQQLDNIFV
jgi:[acyl-carrier-protein] S-malonyltransferase